MEQEEYNTIRDMRRIKLNTEQAQKELYEKILQHLGSREDGNIIRLADADQDNIKQFMNGIDLELSTHELTSEQKEVEIDGHLIPLTSFETAYKGEGYTEFNIGLFEYVMDTQDGKSQRLCYALNIATKDGKAVIVVAQFKGDIYNTNPQEFVKYGRGMVKSIFNVKRSVEAVGLVNDILGELKDAVVDVGAILGIKKPKK